MVDAGLSSVEQRLARLEASNRRLRCALVGLLAVAGFILLTGQAAVVPKEIKAHRLSIVDEQGNERASMDIIDGVAQVTTNAAGAPFGAVMSSWANGLSQICVYDKEGQPRWRSP